MRALTLVILTTLIMLAALAAISPAKAENVNISIKTLDDEPLQGAVVKIFDGDTEVASGETNSGGDATVDINTTTRYTLKVYYPPGNLVFETNDFNYSVTNQFEVDVISEWVIRVKDNSGDIEIEDANVTIVFKHNSTIRFSRMTDNSGVARFGPLPVYPDGKYEVRVEFQGREYTFGEKTLNLATKDITLNLPLYKVTVNVKDLDGLPVEGVTVSLKPELDSDPVSEGVSDEDGRVVLTLVPQDSYYIVARFKDFVVYQSDSKEVSVTNDKEIELSVEAVKLRISVYDADGVDLMAGPHLQLVGELRYGGVLVDETSTIDGVLNFGHVPVETFKLKITLGGLVVYLADYEVSADTAEGSVNAKFYDVILRINSTGFANSSMLKSLNGVMKVGGFEFPFELSEGEAELKNLPFSRNYVAELYYDSAKVGEIEGIKVNKEDKVINLKPQGYRIEIQLKNSENKPLPGKITVSIAGGQIITSFDVGDNGIGSSLLLLPLTYDITAYYEGIEVAKQTITLTSDQTITLHAAVKDIKLKVFDVDSEEALPDVRIELLAGEFRRSGTSNEDGITLIENLPLIKYRVQVWYLGFKVMDGVIDVKPGVDLIELKAPGVLDVKLRFTDSSKNPLDGGLVRLDVGGLVKEVEVGENGEVRISNIPNGTIYLTFLYKGREVGVEPEEFEPRIDESTFTFLTRVHRLTVSILRTDKEPLREGTASIYVDDVKVYEKDLSEGNIIEESLPEGEVTVVVEFKGREVAKKTVFLDTPKKEMNIEAQILSFTLNLMLPSGEPIAGAVIRAEDSKGLVDEVISGETGNAIMMLPQGEYTLKIIAGNSSLEYPLNLEGASSASLILPSYTNDEFLIALSAAIVNLVIMAVVAVKMMAKRAVRRPRRTTTRKRIPRI